MIRKMIQQIADGFRLISPYWDRYDTLAALVAVGLIILIHAL